MNDYTMPMGFVGQQSTQIPATFISRTVEGSNIKSGDPVMMGSDGRYAKKADGSGTFLGIACGSAMITEWAEGDTIRIMTEGAIILKAKAAIAAGETVGFGSSGGFAKAATSNYPNSIDGSQADTGAAADEMFRARIQGTAVTSL